MARQRGVEEVQCSQSQRAAEGGRGFRVSRTYGLSSAGAVPHLGQGQGYVVEHWEDFTSQKAVGHLVGTHRRRLVGF
jgi:hypothetical protein